ncbi:hypothetical protein U27_06204 [Candidatus Vecturithrix granuli]|uniref:KAP NTPase domain-containing protein n=1 Tax=Vecturithrix granuli TaxID=1499967 RepID=A0A081C3S2_VECG1|nr:hypothetical protein U27_06204 [Candidatus Vecturithrix granuli]
MEYNSFKLKENPFRLTPPLNPEEIIWAGMDKLKTELENRIRMSMRTSASRIIINWGNYGSGKTHAANYFSRTPRLKELSDEISVAPAKSIKVNLPRASKDIVQAFWRALLGQIEFDFIVKDFNRLRQLFPSDYKRIINVNANDSIVAELFTEIATIYLNKKNQTQISMDLGIPDQEKIDDIKNYLYGDKTKATLTSLNFPTGIIEDDEQVVNLLSTMFNCLSYEKKIYSEIFLWIDEFEDIDTVNKSAADRFTTFLRQLIDKTPNHLTIFLNFTPKRFLNIEDLSIYLGEALLSRARLKIYFAEPTLEESIDYLEVLLNHPVFRDKEDVNNENNLYPFSEDIVKYVLRNIGRLSMRKINEVFSIILELALIQEVETLSIEFVNSIKEEIISWEGEA